MIDSNINKLISMAERQSDQRLAQELNPQTETGLLGPAFISASELAYRQKIRDEAQAQPSQSPPIVQQLAQQATMSPVQPMPTAPMPMQQPMQQPMPMPQQPIPSFQTGGLVDNMTYGNPFMRMAQTGMPTDVRGNYPFSFDGGGRFISDTFELDPVFNEPIDASPVDLQNTGAFVPTSMPQSDDAIDKILQEAEKKQKRQPTTLQNIGQSLVDFSDRVQARVDARKAAEEERKRKRSIVVDQDRLLQGVFPPKQDGIPVPKIDMSVKTDSIVTPANAQTVQQSAQKKQSDGTLTQTKGTPLSQSQQDTLMAQAKANSSPVTITDTGTQINTTPTTGVSDAAKKDAAYAASSDYETLIQQSINAMTDEKGKMQNKWLRIAAGAFNAAQKGSPTLLGGLADLGAGVTEELLALNKEEQDQAQELFALYAAREKLRLDRYTTEYDYDKDRKTRIADAIKNYNADLARYLNTDITKDMTKREAEAITAITYADQGVKPAQGNYGRFVKEIQGIINDINASDPDLTNDEFKEIFDERIKSDKALSIVYDNYTDRGTLGVEDWLNERLSI
jgi:hypothetical protein